MSNENYTILVENEKDKNTLIKNNLTITKNADGTVTLTLNKPGDIMTQDYEVIPNEDATQNNGDNILNKTDDNVLDTDNPLNVPEGPRYFPRTDVIDNRDFLGEQKRCRDKKIVIAIGVVATLGAASILLFSYRCKIPQFNEYFGFNCSSEGNTGELKYSPIISANKDDLGRGFNIKNTNSETINVQSISFISQLPLNNISTSDDVKVEEVKLEDGYQYILSPKDGASLISIEAAQTKSLMNYTLASIPQGNFVNEFSALPYNVISKNNNSTIEIPTIGEVKPHVTPDYAVLGTLTRDQLTINDPMGEELKTADALVYRSLLVSGEGNIYSSWSPEEVRVMNVLELTKKQTGNQIWLSLSSTCSAENSVDFTLIFSSPQMINKTTDSISKFINSEGLGNDIFDGVVIDYQYWQNACATEFDDAAMITFIKELRQKLNPNKTIYLSIPQGYRINDIIGALSELNGVVMGYHLHTDAPQHKVVTPKVQSKELPTEASATDPTYDVLKGNSTEMALNNVNIEINNAPVVVNFPSMAQSYDNADIMTQWGYGQPFGLSQEVEASSLSNYTFIPQEIDPYSYNGNNGERGIDAKNNIAASVPTEKQLGAVADVMDKNTNLFPKWIAIKDMYSSVGQSLITSAATFFHNKPNQQSTSLISAVTDVITKLRK